MSPVLQERRDRRRVLIGEVVGVVESPCAPRLGAISLPKTSQATSFPRLRAGTLASCSILRFHHAYVLPVEECAISPESME